jgi:acyl carrier protein
MTMRRIKLKLYKVLRTIGLERNYINLVALFNEELKLDEFDKACYLYYLESSFNILIPDKDLSKLETIDNTLNYLYHRTLRFSTPCSA